jgi:hypothetical protein
MAAHRALLHSQPGENQMSFQESPKKNPREATGPSSSPRESLFDDEVMALMESVTAPEADGRAWRLLADRLVVRLRKRAAALGAACLDELADDLSWRSLALAVADGARDLTASEADYIWKSRGEIAQALMEEMGYAGERSAADWANALLN